MQDDIEWKKLISNSVFDTIDKLVHYPTRIIQKNGLFSTSFTCEYFDSTWKTISKNSVPRLFGIGVPKIAGRVKVYS
jgi:hypothetical protein